MRYRDTETGAIYEEIALNEWSSGQSIRAYNRMPEKYRVMIERD